MTERRAPPFLGIFGGLAMVLFALAVGVSLWAERVAKPKPKPKPTAVDVLRPARFVPVAGLLPDGGAQVLIQQWDGGSATFTWGEEP